MEYGVGDWVEAKGNMIDKRYSEYRKNSWYKAIITAKVSASTFRINYIGFKREVKVPVGAIRPIPASTSEPIRVGDKIEALWGLDIDGLTESFWEATVLCIKKVEEGKVIYDVQYRNKVHLTGEVKGEHVRKVTLTKQNGGGRKRKGIMISTAKKKARVQDSQVPRKCALSQYNVDREVTEKKRKRKKPTPIMEVEEEDDYDDELNEEGLLKNSDLEKTCNDLQQDLENIQPMFEKKIIFSSAPCNNVQTVASDIDVGCDFALERKGTTVENTDTPEEPKMDAPAPPRVSIKLFGKIVHLS